MEYRTLQLADKDAVEQVLAPLGRNDSALGFANLYSLTEKYGTEVRLEGRALHVRQRRRLPGPWRTTRRSAGRTSLPISPACWRRRPGRGSDPCSWA